MQFLHKSGSQCCWGYEKSPQQRVRMQPTTSLFALCPACEWRERVGISMFSIHGGSHRGNDHSKRGAAAPLTCSLGSSKEGAHTLTREVQ